MKKNIPALLLKIAEDRGISIRDLRYRSSSDNKLLFEKDFKKVGIKPKQVTLENISIAVQLFEEKRQRFYDKWSLNNDREGQIKVVVEDDPAFREWDRNYTPQSKRELEDGKSQNRTPEGDVEDVGRVEKESKRKKLFDYPITHVLRAMGKEGWTDKEAATAFKSLGLECSKATIYLQLRAGVKGERGEPAKLTKSQWLQLEKVRD